MLRISTKSRYAVRIVAYLAMQDGDRPSRKQDIADAEKISSDYVEQILIRLRGGGLVHSHRGARGGFTLARAAHEMCVLDVLEAAEGPLALVRQEDEPIDVQSIRVTRTLWDQAGEKLRKLFGDIRMSELADEIKHAQQGEQLMYDI